MSSETMPSEQRTSTVRHTWPETFTRTFALLMTGGSRVGPAFGSSAAVFSAFATAAISISSFVFGENSGQQLLRHPVRLLLPPGSGIALVQRAAAPLQGAESESMTLDRAQDRADPAGHPVDQIWLGTR